MGKWIGGRGVVATVRVSEGDLRNPTIKIRMTAALDFMGSCSRFVSGTVKSILSGLWVSLIKETHYLVCLCLAA